MKKGKWTFSFRVFSFFSAADIHGSWGEGRPIEPRPEREDALGTQSGRRLDLMAGADVE
jgi:hypothetical protein